MKIYDLSVRWEITEGSPAADPRKVVLTDEVGYRFTEMVSAMELAQTFNLLAGHFAIRAIRLVSRFFALPATSGKQNWMPLKDVNIDSLIEMVPTRPLEKTFPGDRPK